MVPIDVPLRLLHALIPWTETVPSHNNPHSILPLCAFCIVQLDDEFKSTHFVTAAHTGDTTKAPDNPRISKCFFILKPPCIFHLFFNEKTTEFSGGWRFFPFKRFRHPINGMPVDNKYIIFYRNIMQGIKKNVSVTKLFFICQWVGVFVNIYYFCHIYFGIQLGR